MKEESTESQPISHSTMSGNKAALKAAKTALDAEKWDEAITQAQIVLASDSQNYFAYVSRTQAFIAPIVFLNRFAGLFAWQQQLS